MGRKDPLVRTFPSTNPSQPESGDKKHRDNWTFNLGYKLTPAITLGYELDYNSLDDAHITTKKGKETSYSGFNGKDRTWEHNLSAGYKINKEWEPFVEFGWIQLPDENVSHSGTNIYGPRYRFGLKYNF